ncbi:MAG: patatin-like phospholipase family protein [Nitrososphaeraceae archaeon]
MAIKGGSIESTSSSSKNSNGHIEIEAGQPEKGSNNKKEKPVVFAGPEQIVYEGGKVQLEGFCNLDQNGEANKDIIYDWYFVKESSDTEISQKEFKGIKDPIFTAPYVDFRPERDDQKVTDRIIRADKYRTFSKITFKLIATDKSTNLKSEPSLVTIIVKMVQRALVLQGGGALGAYELGAYKALCEKLITKDSPNGENVRKNRPLFDIISGTSIGALNAALITRSVVDGIGNSENDINFNIQKIWSKSVQELEKFWSDITLPFVWISKSNPLFTESWNLWSKSASYQLEYLKNFLSLYYQGQPPDLQANYLNPFYLFLRPDLYTQPADIEAARRFFAWLLYPYASLAQVITPNFIQPDTKFFAGIPQFTRFDNRPLVNIIERRYWDSKHYPLATDYLKGEPRLLLVSVDILDATSAVTFDSYLRKSQYTKGEIDKGENGEDDSSYRDNQKQQERQRLIDYPDGITMEHVRASMSPYTVIDYPKFEDIQNQETRYFWDGAFLSNTPLRELLHLHRYYWHDVVKVEHVPHLEVYIINLYPTVEKNQIDLPKDADTIQDREIDIRFHDRTRYDVKVAEIISDYLILHGQLKNLAIKCINALADDDLKKGIHDRFEREYNKLLDEMKPHSKGRREEAELERSLALKMKKSTENSRTYRDLIEGRFDVTNVIYVNRLDDGQTIFGKAAEFSRETMENLRDQGYADTQVAFDFAMNRE